MGNLDGFDASTVEPNVGFDPVPAGDYLICIQDSEFKETLNKDGEYLELKTEIIEGDHKGKFVFDRLNLKNKNEIAVKIAMSQLSAICHAVGILRPKDSVELHNKPILATISLEERKDKPGYFTNRIKSYKDPRSLSPAQKQQAAGQPQQTPPWKK